ncbi:MAG: hypothetical protein ACOX3W_04305 [Christensenellaceae bacterium]|jgi:hypothetical protein
MNTKWKRILLSMMIIFCLLASSCGDKLQNEPQPAAMFPIQEEKVDFGTPNQVFDAINFWIPENMQKQQETDLSVEYKKNNKDTLTIIKRNNVLQSLSDMEEYIKSAAITYEAIVLYEGIFYVEGKGIYEALYDLKETKGQIYSKLLITEEQIYEFAYISNEKIDEEIVGELNAVIRSIVIENSGNEKIYSIFEILPYKPNIPLYGPGRYQVGKDILPGEYLLISTLSIAGGGGYYALAKNDSGKFSSVIYNEKFETFTIADMKKGDFLEIKNAEFFLLDQYIQAAPFDVRGKIGRGESGLIAGTYKVSTMVLPGEYHIMTVYEGQQGVVKAFRDSRGKNVVETHFFEKSYDLLLEEGQYIYLQFANMIEK